MTIWLLLGIVGLIGGTFVLSKVLADSVPERPRPVLPSHYNVERYRSVPPGLCRECGARNESRYEYCRNCATELSTPDGAVERPNQ